MTGSAALFYLTNSEYRSEQSVRLRRQVIQVVLNGMESYQEVTVSPSWPGLHPGSPSPTFSGASPSSHHSSHPSSAPPDLEAWHCRPCFWASCVGSTALPHLLL